MKAELHEKSIIVTGAGAGIGRAAAIACAAAGARVVVADINRPAGLDTESAIRAQGGSATFVHVDVAVEAQVESMVEAAMVAYGRLDGAFNNAGLSQHNVPIHELDAEQWRRLQSVNYDGVFFCLKHEIRAMLRTGGGAIVNTSSALGRVGIPNAAEYCASKGGVLGLTKGAAVDYAGKNIRVNAILPGMIRTPMVEALITDPRFADLVPVLLARHPIGRLGMPAEVADAAVWLLSDRSSFVTGAEVSVDGGYLAI